MRPSRPPPTLDQLPHLVTVIAVNAREFLDGALNSFWGDTPGTIRLS